MTATLLQPAHTSLNSGAPAHRAPRWVEVLSHLEPRYGGLSSAVPALAQSLAAGEGGAPFRVALTAFCAAGEQFVPQGFAAGNDVSFWPMSRLRWVRDAALREQLTELVRGAAGVHLHGLWELSTAAGAAAARRAGVPYLVSAHGMLEPWALRQRKWRKRLYAAAVERRTLHRARALHALTHAEAHQFAAFGVGAPVAVVPNPVSVPDGTTAESFLTQFPELRGTRVVLFCGRLHPKKGLDLLLDAWALLRPHHSDARLVLAGPDSGDTRARLEQQAAALGLGGSVVFAGMLVGQQKWSALRAAEVAVLPSRSEGLSMSVLEAMATGLPVVIPEGCNLPEVQEHGAGWVVPPERTALHTALDRVLSQDPAENAAMGSCGALLVQKRFAPGVVARQMSELYLWAAGGARPTSLELLEPGVHAAHSFATPAAKEAF